jgi:SAM-dependent methyltransferase
VIATLLAEDPRAFSAIADVYDSEYSSQLTIRLQRRIYWQYLNRYLTGASRRVLDMNCGTGSDAVHVVEAYPTEKHHVTGVDISPKMIAQFNAKAIVRGIQDNMFGYHVPLQRLGELSLEPFDLVTSNFGGLNCLTEEELRSLAATLRNRFTNPGARVVAVVMPSFCAIETAYYLAKGDAASAFRRRQREGVSANIGGTYIHTYYYTAKHFASLMEGFSVERVLPLGLFLPPSYIDNLFRRYPILTRASATGEKLLSGLSIGANLSDHYIIDLKRR